MGSAGTSRLHPFTDEWPGFNPVGASVSGKPLSSGVRCGVPLTNGSEFQMIVGWGVDRVAGTFADPDHTAFGDGVLLLVLVPGANVPLQVDMQ